MVLYTADLGNKRAKLLSEKIEKALPNYFIESELYGDTAFNILPGNKDTKIYESSVRPGVKYTWGNDLDVSLKLTDTSLFDIDRYKSDEFKMLVDFALGELAIHDVKGDTPIHVDVVAGLPTDDWLNPAAKEEAQKVIKGQHEVVVDDKKMTIIVDRILTIPQPLGTIFDMICDEHGQIVDHSLDDSNFGVVDVGGGTVLIEAFRGLNMVGDKRLQSRNGAYDLYRKIAKQLHTDGIHLTEYQIEKIIRSGNTLVATKEGKKDIAPLIEEEKEKFLRRVCEDVRTAYKGFDNVEKIFFTGGAANLLDLTRLQKELGNIGALIVIVPDSELTNVRGFRKFGLFSAAKAEA